MRKKLVRAVTLLMIAAILSIPAVAQLKTLRYPRLTFDPAPQSHEFLEKDLQIKASGAYLKSDTPIIFRAFRPSISLELQGFSGKNMTLIIENIHPQALLETSLDAAYISETTHGLARHLQLTASDSNLKFKLNWHFPEKNNYRFGVLGDTGGDRELDWGLMRLDKYGVDFILHMGDLYYFPTEVGQVHEHFNRAQVPVYATIGNHDFHGVKGNTHKSFSRNIGPLNSVFRLLNSCFINVDSAVAMYPASAGYRGAFMNRLIHEQKQSAELCEKIVYTHKPFTDGLEKNSIPHQDHSIDGYQAKWLRQQFEKLGDITLLSGHIHEDLEFSLPGIKTYVTGTCLAGEDLNAERPLSKYLIGEIHKHQAVQFSWISANMPLAYHCSKKIWAALERQGDSVLLNRLQSACGETG